MNELLELLESTKNNGIEVSIPLTNVIEECLVEARHSDDFTVGNILVVSSYIINCYAFATGTTYLNTIDGNQVLEFKTILNESVSNREFEKEFNLFCKNAFDLISWYIETIPY